MPCAALLLKMRSQPLVDFLFTEAVERAGSLSCRNPPQPGSLCARPGAEAGRERWPWPPASPSMPGLVLFPFSKGALLHHHRREMLPQQLPALLPAGGTVGRTNPGANEQVAMRPHCEEQPYTLRFKEARTKLGIMCPAYSWAGAGLDGCSAWPHVSALGMPQETPAKQGNCGSSEELSPCVAPLSTSVPCGEPAQEQPAPLRAGQPSGTPGGQRALKLAHQLPPRHEHPFSRLTESSSLAIPPSGELGLAPEG